MRFLVEIGSNVCGFSRRAAKCLIVFSCCLIIGVGCYLHKAEAGEATILSISLPTDNIRKQPLVTAKRTTKKKKKQSKIGPLRGWDHLYELMLEKGVDSVRLRAILGDRRMPIRRPLFFAVNPKEPRSLYRSHNNKKARKRALKFHQAYYDWFREAEERFGVPQEVVLSVLQIESQCGGYTGRSPIFYRLARLASASDEKNIDNNYRLRYAARRRVTKEDVAQRAKWLEETFLPHAVAALEMADKLQVHPLDLKGSPAGALGLPQFLPGNIEHHGADGDSDGAIDLFNPPDAIFSVARFLQNHGWNEQTITKKQQAEVVWHYNHSKSYVETVLAMARKLKPQVLKKKQEIEVELLQLATKE